MNPPDKFEWSNFGSSKPAASWSAAHGFLHVQSLWDLQPRLFLLGGFHRKNILGLYWSSSHARWKRNTHTNNHRHRHTHTQTHIETRMTETTSFFGCFSDSSAKIHMGPAISIPETGGTANQPGEIWKSMLSMLPTARPKQLEHTHIYIYICVYNYIDYKQYSMAHTTGRICRLLLLSPLGWPIELPCNLQSRSIPVADSSDLFWARL